MHLDNRGIWMPQLKRNPVRRRTQLRLKDRLAPWLDRDLLAICLFVLVACAVCSYGVIFVADRQATDACDVAYSKAKTHEDSVSVDRLVIPPQSRHAPEPLSCGELRRRQSKAPQ